jgi:hypothetical protein
MIILVSIASYLGNTKEKFDRGDICAGKSVWRIEDNK